MPQTYSITCLFQQYQQTEDGLIMTGCKLVVGEDSTQDDKKALKPTHKDSVQIHGKTFTIWGLSTCSFNSYGETIMKSIHASYVFKAFELMMGCTAPKEYLINLLLKRRPQRSIPVAYGPLRHPGTHATLAFLQCPSSTA